MRNIINKVLAVLAMMGRWVAKTVHRGGKATVEWAQEKVVPALEVGFEHAMDAAAALPGQVLSFPGRLMDRLFSSRGGAIEPPAEGASSNPQQGRNKAAERAHQEAQDTDLALSVRAAARALLRGQEPTVALPPAVDAWLRHVGESSWVYLAAMKPEQVSAVLQGRGTAHVQGFEPDAWAGVSFVRPVAAPAPQAAERTPEQVQDYLRGVLRSDAREKVAERWGINGRPAAGDAPAPRRAAGIRP